ncbi:MAG TPA: glycosyltransferase, partial [Pirellulales bacterium]|nr:glycosyltransferase [Pirellulales bacterium]
DPLPWIAAIDVGVLPTYYVGETLPNFVMECQAQGKPVIATDVAGIREMLTVDGALCGELIPLANDGRADVASLAQAMNSYLHDSARRMADGELAKRGALRFDIRATAAAYERLFEEITLPPGQAHARLAEAIAVDVAAAG